MKEPNCSIVVAVYSVFVDLDFICANNDPLNELWLSLNACTKYLEVAVTYEC